ncbi:MAG: sigma-70 family RNA polymerase sigma factor [Planctomycetes bacterium]|nr:sigma-70 family RNA polymerase sigma factor [Planctomycetota bacterium]
MDPTSDPHAITTYHVARARAGDRESLEWIVKRFTPLLLASARYRLGKTLGELYDPEDLVNDVWVAALPKLSTLRSQEGRYTPVLLRFLSRTLLFRVNNLIEKHIRGKPRRERARAPHGEEAADPLAQLPAETTAIVARLVREEEEGAVAAALESLSRRDRELVILRGVERLAYKEIAALLGEAPSSLAVRYRRALVKLRRRLPGSIYDELAEEQAGQTGPAEETERGGRPC